MSCRNWSGDRSIKSGIILNNDEVKAIIAEYYKVPLENVIRSKYSYIVVDAKGREILKDK